MLIDRTRALQIGLLALLAICVAQALWWILDETNHSRAVLERAEQYHAQQARTAEALLARGLERGEVAALFPQLEISAGDGPVTVPPAVREALWAERRRRLNRFRWEGAFFLVVLLIGMGILARAIRRDGELKRRQQNFLAAVSHEFKSPIASLRLSAETLALRDPPAAKRTQLVGRMLDELQRLETMVLNLLDTTRIEAGRIEYRPERLDLGRLTQGAIEELAQRAGEQEIELVNEIPATIEVQVDPVAARTILYNLLDNAIKATAASPGGRIRVRARQADGRVNLEVLDTGVGFAPREARRLFEKFYRPGDELRRRSRGSGLGLYLVQRLVEIGKGTVRAHSDGPGQGAVFTVSWPACTENGA